MYGRQVKDLFDHFPREQVLLLRYKTLVDAWYRRRFGMTPVIF